MKPTSIPAVVAVLMPILFLCLPRAAEAQFTYTTNNGTITITGYSGPGGVVMIPSNINGLTVTGIGNSVFKQNTSLTGVSIPNTVTTIGNNAFDTCLLLPQVVIPDSVTNVGSYAFEVCINLTNVNLGNGMLTLGAYAFYNDSKLNSLILGTNIINIGGHGFDGCGLTSIHLPDNVVALGGAAFQLNNHLTNAVIGKGVTSVPDNAFGSDSALTSVVIGPNVTSIGSQAFTGCGLTSVMIPDPVTLIDISAFNNNANLTRVVVGSSVNSIGIDAFNACTHLTGIYFKGNAPSLGTGAFSGDTATVYYLPWTSGWTSPFGGLSTAVWHPPVEPAGPAMQSNGFGFALAGLSNQVVVVLASTNLPGGVWVPLATNTLTGGSNFFHDGQSANFPHRFYRLQTQ